MKEYIKATVEFVELASVDVICTSNGLTTTLMVDGNAVKAASVGQIKSNDILGE